MSGALNRAAGRRKRFAQGGDADDQPYEAMGWTPDAGGALNQAPTDNGDASASSPGPPGALGQSADPDAARLIRARQNLAAAQNVRMILAASQGQQPVTQQPAQGAPMVSAPPLQATSPSGGAPPTSGMSGAWPGGAAPNGQWSDMTKMAIAGALLSPPGGPGGFTASLGKGLSAGAEMTERERQLQEQAALRRAQLQETQEWHRQMGGARQTTADAAALRAAAYSKWANVKADMAANPANYAATGQNDQDGHPLIINKHDGTLVPNMDVTVGVTPNVAAHNETQQTIAQGHDTTSTTNTQTRVDAAAQAAEARNALIEKHNNWIAANAPNAQVGQMARSIYQSGITTDPYSGAKTITISPQEAIERARSAVTPQAGPRATAAPAAPQGPRAPQPGEIVGGYKYLGGDPRQQSSWAPP
jgi:hypothetical protein